MKKLILQLAAAAFLLAASSPAFCHAALEQSEPRVGSTVSAPREVVLTFTEQLEPAFSLIEVRDGGGKRVDAGKTQVTRNTMRVSLRSLSAGTYKVIWRALSVDTHQSQGNFNFSVKP